MEGVKKIITESIQNSLNMLAEVDKAALKLEEEKKDLAIREAKLESDKKEFRKLKKMEEKKREAVTREFRELDGRIQAIKRKAMEKVVVEDRNKVDDCILKKLKVKEEALSDLEATNNVLTIQQRQLSAELHELRKELIKNLMEEPMDGIGVKMMGELDSQVFVDAIGGHSHYTRAKTFYIWKSLIRDSSFYPFKIICDEQGEHILIVDVENERLKLLGEKYGDEVLFEVERALLEINEYNPSGRYPVPEFWNFKEDRKASLSEVVAGLFKCLKASTDEKKRPVGMNHSVPGRYCGKC